MNYEELLKSMNSIRVELKRMMKIVLDKQEALIERNSEKITEIVKQEEKVLSAISTIEKKREIVLSEFRSELQISDDITKISEIIKLKPEFFSKEQKRVLLEMEEYVRNYAVEVWKVNQQNSFLIQHSIHFVEETINTLLQSGKLSIIDRKG